MLQGNHPAQRPRYHQRKNGPATVTVGWDTTPDTCHSSLTLIV
jgi:hypothetical protein